MVLVVWILMLHVDGSTHIPARVFSSAQSCEAARGSGGEFARYSATCVKSELHQ